MNSKGKQYLTFFHLDLYHTKLYFEENVKPIKRFCGYYDNQRACFRTLSSITQTKKRIVKKNIRSIIEPDID